MKRVLLFLLLTAAAGLVQVSFLDRIQFFGAKPDLFLALTVIAAVTLNPPRAFWIGLFGGLLKDVLDSGPFAINVIMFPLMAFIISRLNRTLSLENRLSCSIITALAVIILNIGAWIALAYSQVSVPHGVFLRIMFLEALITALASAALFVFTRSSTHSAA